jgi:hypothetical protein
MTQDGGINSAQAYNCGSPWKIIAIDLGFI